MISQSNRECIDERWRGGEHSTNIRSKEIAEESETGAEIDGAVEADLQTLLETIVFLCTFAVGENRQNTMGDGQHRKENEIRDFG